MNLNVRDGRRCAAEGAYLRPVMDHKAVTILAEAQAVKLAGISCTGFDFPLEGELRCVGVARELIPCAGPIHTPSLVL
jgi:choline dehydrogenase-like flavoprotein